MSQSMQLVLDLNQVDYQNILNKVKDIPEQEMTKFLPGLPNHPLWQLGHVTAVHAAVSRLVGQPAELPDNWAALFAPGSTPTDDASKYPSKQQVLEIFERVNKHTAQAVLAASDAQLDARHDIEPLKNIWPTVRHVATALLTFHNGYHIGQLADWLRAAKSAASSK